LQPQSTEVLYSPWVVSVTVYEPGERSVSVWEPPSGRSSMVRSLSASGPSMVKSQSDESSGTTSFSMVREASSVMTMSITQSL